MKTNRLLAVMLFLGCFPTNLLAASPTVFTYQGRLTGGGAPANGSFDFRFALYDAVSGGSQQGGTLTNTATAVSNGLFTVALDFGAGIFTGPERWLEIAVRASPADTFNSLAPRQPLTASPYALYAPNAGAASLATNLPAGTVTASMLADGAVTGGKLAPGAVKTSNLDDGGNAAYDNFVNSTRSFQTTNVLPFEALFPVPTNGGTPSLVLTLNGEPFGTVAGFVGNEGLSQPYAFVAEVIAPAGSLDPERQLGRAGRIAFTRGGRTTAFAGRITGCSASGYTNASALYTFRIESPLALLARSSDYRIYQDDTVPTITANNYRDVSGETLTAALSGSYSTREAVNQHGESHLNFFSRLLEEEGIFYFFNQTAELPVLMLGDGANSLLGAPYGGLHYYGNQTTNIPAGAEFVRSFYQAKHQSTKCAMLKSYDFKKPRANLTANSYLPQGIGETYQFVPPLTQTGDLDQRLRIILDRQGAEHTTYFADGNAADLRPGYTFLLDDRTGSGLGDTYLVTAVRHAAFRRVTNGVASLFYGNQCEVIPSAVPFRPAVQTPKPVAHPTTAVVTGPTGEEMYVDQYGRVKAQFYWDRYGTNSQNSSAWIRVASPLAGKNWGMVFLPRIGQEVIVDFLNGDPDQPVIIGSLYNADLMHPYDLPADKARSGIKTQSTKGGTAANFNELRFDDRKGAEEIYLHGEKDVNLSAENDINLSADHDFAFDVGNDLTLHVGNNFTLNVGSALTIAAPSIQFSTSISIGTTNNPAFALSTTGAVAAAAFQGDGAALGNLSAAALATGTLSDARLSGNVALRSGGNTFTGEQVISSGSLRLSDQRLYLRGGGDTFHGLAWYSAGTFAGANPDGPVLFGCGGGALGSMCGSPKLALAWNDLGNVMIDPGSQNSGTLTPGLTFGPNSGEGIASRRSPGANQFGLDFYTFGTNRLSIANGGHVGIGTSQPVRRLQVVDPDGNGGSIQVGSQIAGPTPKLINFGDGDFVHIGESGADDRLELKASAFFFTGGNVGLGTNTPQQKLHVVGNILATGTITPNSDRSLKTGFAPVDTAAVLERVAALPIQQWRFQTEPEPVKHVGPMAQDFRAAFGLGEIPTAIATVDADGIALAAIQGLNRKVEAENAALRAELKAKDAVLESLQKRLEALEHKLIR